ncbi:MAG: tripeptidyl peptidase II, partial [Planctomycetaceae bacterium]|nr:tripeptidyl peptidase II [Planctomycetaceae bacterium]
AKQQQLAYNPFSVRKAVQNTAKPIPDAEVFAAGPGLIQIDRAWDYLQQRKGRYGDLINYDIRFPSLNNARGVYLRDPQQSKQAQSLRAYVTPDFPDDTPIETRLQVNLVCKMSTTADWVKTGDLLHLHHGGNRFDVEIDPTALEPGVHYAEVHAYEANANADQPMFRVPVTVVIPIKEQPEEGEYEFTSEFVPGKLVRHYFDVPEGATSCSISMELADTTDSKFFRLHTLQLVDGEDFEHYESGNYYAMTPGVETTTSFPVVPGRTLEVVLGQYWAILGASKLEYEITFHGGSPDDASLTLARGQGPQEVSIRNDLNPLRIAPKGSLTTWRTWLLPKSSSITGLGLDRDQLPDGSPVYQLELKYSLKLDKSSKVTISVPGWDKLLYDSQVDPFLSQIRNQHGKLIATNDMFADPVSLPEGEYEILISTQHSDPAVLKSHENIELAVDRSLSSPVSLKFWSSPAAAANGASSSTSGVLAADDQVTYFVGEPAASSLPKGLSVGDCLMGDVTYAADEELHTRFSVRYYYTVDKASAAAAGSSDDAKGDLAELIRDLKKKHLKTLDPLSEDFTKLFEELRAEKPEDRDPMVTKLELLDSDEKRKERLEAVIAAADEVIAAFDQNKLAATLGKRVPADDKEAAKEQKTAEADKKVLIDALYRKARAIGYRELPEVVDKQPIADQAAQDQQFAEALKALEVWQDLNEEQSYLLLVRKHRRTGEYAQAIQLLNKKLDESSPLLHYKKRRDMFGEMGWEAWQSWQQQQMLLDFPKEHPPYK